MACKEVLVGEGLHAQEVELAFQILNVAAHRSTSHTPPAHVPYLRKHATQVRLGTPEHATFQYA